MADTAIPSTALEAGARRAAWHLDDWEVTEIPTVHDDDCTNQAYTCRLCRWGIATCVADDILGAALPHLVGHERVRELLEANNREVERRRAAEAKIERLRSLLFPLGWGVVNCGNERQKLEIFASIEEVGQIIAALFAVVFPDDASGPDRPWQHGSCTPEPQPSATVGEADGIIVKPQEQKA